ncbi:MAG: glycosyltransferase family 4 protein, partial [Akkermansia sp.]
GLFIASGPQTQARLQQVAGLSQTLLSPIIAVREDEIAKPHHHEDATEPYLIYAGGLRPEKGPFVMLRALAKLWARGCRIPLKMAAVPAAAIEGLRADIAALGLPAEAVQILPFMPRHELMDLMRSSRAFLCFNFRDSGCMALLEAVALGVPSICFDNEEQFWLPHEFSCKLAVRGQSMAQLEDALAEAMRSACESPRPDGAWHARRMAWLRRCMTWDARLRYLEACYHLVCTCDSQLLEPPILPSFDCSL